MSRIENMAMHKWLKFGFCVLVSIFCSATASGCEADVEPSRHPNVLVLFSDDQRADTIHSLGNAHIRTPNLDGLVDCGTSFTRAYCMGAHQGAVCVPSRAMFLSGRNLFHVNDQLTGIPTWPEAFAAAGYETFISGKWHNGEKSLARTFGQGKAVFLGGMTDPWNARVVDLTADRKLVNQRKSGKHSVELFADSAISFLEQPHAKPFLCYVAFNLPHDPRVAPNRYHAHYNANKPPLPANFLPEHPFDNGELWIRDELLAPFPRSEDVVRQHLADYYAAIEFLDAQIGRILTSLKAANLAENTIVVFTSDHGLAIGSHGLFGKQNLYDQSMHVPLIFAGPGVPEGRKSDAFCYLFDVFPTLGALADVKPPQGSTGLSLLPAMKGASASMRDAIYTEYRDVQRAIRDDRWKLIRYPKIDRIQLFDLRQDPDERNDLAANPEHKSQVERMEKLLDAAREQYQP